MAAISDLFLAGFASDDDIREAVIAVTLDTRVSVERTYYFDNGVAYTDSTYSTQATFTDILHPQDAIRWTQGTELHSRIATRGAQTVLVFIPVGVLFWTDPTDDDRMTTWNRRLVLAYHNSMPSLKSFAIEGLRVEGCTDSYQDLLIRGRSLGSYQ